MKHFRQQRRPKKSSLVGGSVNIIQAFQDGILLDRIYMAKNFVGKQAEHVKSLATAHQVPINVVPIEKLNGFNIANDGCVAIISRIKYYELQEIISSVVDRGEAPLVLLLDGITDIRNIGGIARTALCTGVHAIVIPDKGVGSLNEDAVLTSAGALEQIPVCRVNSLLKAVDELHLNGIKVLASQMEATNNVYDVNFTEPVAIVMGSEEKGIYPALMKACDQSIKIPMHGSFESLNVSVATGMILYEAMKQRIQH